MFRSISKVFFLFALFPFLIGMILWELINPQLSYSYFILGILFIIIAYGISSSNKKWIITSIMLLFIPISRLFISGFYDDKFYLLNTIISIISLLYYSIYFCIKYWFSKNKNYFNKVDEYFSK